ncbi:cysteine desulfurase [Candidatus Micrarchaeota archaeon CG08_land_8_20_14_0_20_49_17]|nr:MAG: hypothetical protein AUJ13_02990 [Candidatus Micrarchaeota archaeon CG1_02_49_24]PIU09803.1 MAG: cysteine desulfurase [Candidatus Micrarchaeota archaeon CG08_land_8_20_14_0_20_49_17]PIZ95667.1 MAG: cysteine desulfurase [Candidatus Micrarchaeota archaeon CG_4_10_14_0_2_um_filter_49_7]HII53835.1 cysteine desulfurase [Candidatus Micrarchaeota archaeon]
MDLKAIRSDFPLFKTGIIYLDNAATSLTPVQVVEELKDYYLNCRANIHRGLHKLSARASEHYEQAKETVANYINAKPEEIVFTKNATESINLVANSIRYRQGDTIITSDIEHHSNFLPWKVQERNGAKVVMKSFGELEESAAPAADSKVIALTHVSNVLGEPNDLEKIGKNNGDALFLIDGAQSAPHMKIDVKKLNCDFFAFSGHKMLGPTGIGVLYIREEVMERLEPVYLGGGTISGLDERFNPIYSKGYKKFEAGTPNIAGAIGLAEAIRYLDKIGMENIHRHETGIAAYMRKLVDEINGDGKIEYYSKSGLIFSFNVKGLEPHDVSAMLDAMGDICTRSGHHCAIPLMRKLAINGCVRASPYLYNTKEEVGKFVETLKEICKLG